MTTKGKEKIENLEANIVIIGGGGSGLVAAVAAAEKGAKGITVLERMGSLGGVTRMAQGFSAYESSLQQREQFLYDKDVVFKALMATDNWATVNPRILRAFINKSGDTVSWFMEKGVHFEIKAHDINQARLIHWPLKGEGPEFGRGLELIRALTRECQKLGIATLTRTIAKRLIRDANGNMAGVVAVKDGQEFEIKARSVIIATGNMGLGDAEHSSGDPDWDETGKSVLQRNVDGDNLAAEIGAAIIKKVESTYHGDLDYGVKASLAIDKNEPLVHVVGEPYVVKINKLGRRYVDEASSGARGANPLQPGNVTFTLFDEQMRRDIEERGVLIGKGWGLMECAVRTELPGLEKALQKWSQRGEEPVVKITDSWDEMAKWMGVDPAVLKAEIDEYNSFCDHGYDEIFAKERRYLKPLRTPPYYGLRILISSPWLQAPQDKIQINERMEVIDAEFKAIPGLYAVGVITGGWEVSHPHYGGPGPLGFAMVSGRIAGENAAELVLKQA